MAKINPMNVLNILLEYYRHDGQRASASTERESELASHLRGMLDGAMLSEDRPFHIENDVQPENDDFQLDDIHFDDWPFDESEDINNGVRAVTLERSPVTPITPVVSSNSFRPVTSVVSSSNLLRKPEAFTPDRTPVRPITPVVSNSNFFRKPDVVTLDTTPLRPVTSVIPTNGLLRKPVAPPQPVTPSTSTIPCATQYQAKFRGNCQDDGSTGRFAGQNHAHSAELNRVFRATFGLKKFRQNQLEAINAAMLNEDCFILMPTGGGKSLCYQLPALVGSGVTVVISPLRSLIQDQVQHLTVKRINARAFMGDTDQQEQTDIYSDIESDDPSIRLLYVTPEKISKSARLQNAFQRMYQNGKLARFVIDEAHCVSQWGHDFRPDYKLLCSLRKTYKDVPMMALTATANPRVRGDILTQLGMRQPKWFMQSFNRPNLKYDLRPKGKDSLKDLTATILNEFTNQSGIVYCLSKKDCDDLAKALSDEGIQAAPYHAGLGDELRAETQRKWTRDRVKVVCATIAFGMGIDKPDVRFVIHFSLPKSIEGYYQETGRAGRDGKSAVCILFYNFHDAQRNRKLLSKDKSGTWESRKVHLENLQRVIAFCESKAECRRGMLLEYFGEQFDRKDCRAEPRSLCDNCQAEGNYAPLDVTEDAKEIVKCLTTYVGPAGQNRRNNLTLIQLADLLKGSKNNSVLTKKLNELSIYGKGTQFSRTDLDCFVRRMIVEEVLEEVVTTIQLRTGPTVCCYVGVGPKAADLLAGRLQLVIHTMVEGGKKKVVTQRQSPMEELEDACASELRRVLQEFCQDKSYTYTALVTLNALYEIAKSMPRSVDDLLLIDGMTSSIAGLVKDVILPVTQTFSLRRQTLPTDDSYLDVLPVEPPRRTRASENRSKSSGTSSRKVQRRAHALESSDEEENVFLGENNDNDNNSIICIEDSDDESLGGSRAQQQARSPYFGSSRSPAVSRKRPSPDTGGTAKKRVRATKGTKKNTKKSKAAWPRAGASNWRSGNKKRGNSGSAGLSNGGISPAPLFGGRLDGTLQRAGAFTSSGPARVYNESGVETSGGGSSNNRVNMLRKPQPVGGTRPSSVDWLMPLPKP